MYQNAATASAPITKSYGPLSHAQGDRTTLGIDRRKYSIANQGNICDVPDMEFFFGYVIVPKILIIVLYEYGCFRMAKCSLVERT